MNRKHSPFQRTKTRGRGFSFARKDNFYEKKPAKNAKIAVHNYFGVID